VVTYHSVEFSSVAQPWLLVGRDRKSVTQYCQPLKWAACSVTVMGQLCTWTKGVSQSS